MTFKAFIRSSRDLHRWVATADNRAILAAVPEDVIYAESWEEAQAEFESRFPLPAAYGVYSNVLSTVALRQTEGYYGPASSVVLHQEIPLWASGQLDLDLLQRIVDKAGPVRLVRFSAEEHRQIVERFPLGDDYVVAGTSMGLILSRDAQQARREREAARRKARTKAISVSDLKSLSCWLAGELPITIEHGSVGMDGAVLQLARVLAIHQLFCGPRAYRQCPHYRDFIAEFRTCRLATFHKWRQFPGLCEWLERESRARLRAEVRDRYQRPAHRMQYPFDPKCQPALSQVAKPDTAGEAAEDTTTAAA